MQTDILNAAIGLLAEILYVFVTIKYFETFFKKKSIRGIFGYVFLINMFVQMLSYEIVKYPAFGRIITVALAVFLISNFFEGGAGERMVFSLLYVALSMFAELLIACIFVAYNIADSFYEVGYCVTYLVLFVFLSIMQYFFQNTMVGILSWKTNLKIILVPIGSMFLAYRIFYTQYELGIKGFYWKTMLSIVILLCLNIMIFDIFVKLSENLELRRRTSIYEKEFDLLEQHMHEREKLMQDFRVKRHDLKHQMHNLLDLLQQGRFEKLEGEIEQLAELRSLDGLFLVQTDNSIIDTFVNNKYAIAHEHGIQFEADLRVPAELPFAGEDLCVILGNALDNAIEACLRGKVENPYIKLQMLFDGDNLTMIVKNSFDGKMGRAKKGGWTTRKTDSQQHGIGIYSIKNTIKKYNGYYHVEVNGKVYCLEMILYRKSE